MPRMEQTPGSILREKTGLDISGFARETGLSRPTVYLLDEGGKCGASTWRKLKARWPLELRSLGLTADDFLDGRVGR